MATHRLAWLDLLRGIAILGVVLVHCGQRPLTSTLLANVSAAGQYGVQLFFVVSACTISMTYLRHCERHGYSPRTASAWLVKRLFRIWPLYAVALFFYAIEYRVLNAYTAMSPPAPTSTLTGIVANLALIHAWVPSSLSTVPGGWSIGVEAVFYGLFPILMIWRNSQHFLQMLFAVAVALLVTSEIVNLLLNGTLAVTNNSYLYFWPPTQLPAIMFGCLFFFIFTDQRGSPKGATPPLIIAAALLVFVGCGLWLGTLGRVSPALAPTVFALAFCCLALLAASGRLYFAGWQLVARVGVCSYSIYLVHFAVIDLLRLALKMLSLSQDKFGLLPLSLSFLFVTIVSYGIATWTRRYIELPCIELGRRLATRMVS